MTRYDLSTAYTLLYDSIPGIDVTMDSTSRSLIVTGTHSMVLAAQQIIDELENNINYTLQVVPLNRDFPQEILSALPRIEPQVSVTYDQKNRRLLVAGPQREVKRMQVYIHSVLASTPDEQDSVYYYDSRRDIPNGTIDFIKKAVPQVELQYDAGSRRFTIFGTPTEQLMVSKLITDAENNLPPDEETRYYTFDLKVSDRMIQLLNDAVPKIPEVKRDDYNPSVLIVRAKPALHEKIAEAIEHLKTEFPVDETNIFEVYPVTEEIRSNFEQVRADFENENGKINVLKDTSKNKLTVWALPKQHARLKLLLEQLGQVTDSGKDQAHFYNLKHTDAETLIEVLKDLYDTDLRVTNDAANARLILFGKPDIIKEALETLKSLDDTGADAPKRYYHSYDVQGFYSYDSLGNYYTPVYFVRDISKLVPAAKVSYDYYNHRLIVWGTEEEHKIVKETVSGMTKDNSPAKRVIRYEIRRMSGSRLVQLISQVYPNADPSFDEASNSIIVRGNVLMLDEIKEFLELVDPENPGELDPVLKFYPVGAEPSDSLISAVKQLIPNAAKVEADVQGKQIVVIARPSEQKVVEDNIKSIVETFTSPEQKMIAYPIYGADLESLKESMSNVYPDAKIEIDERGRRLLIWATLEEHEKISEEVSQINKGSEDEEGNGASLVPKVQTYTAGSMAQILQLVGIIEILAPSAEMFPDPRKPSWQYQFNQPGRATVPKITVIAPTRDQKLIAAMIEQFKQADETERFDFVIYPFGNADATSVETMLRGVLRTAESMSPMSLQREMLGRPQYDYGMYGMRGRETAFFRVDDRTKTAAVFASTEDQERIKSVIEQMAQLGETEAKLFTKIYRIPNPIVLSVYPSLQRMVPTAQVIPLSGTEILAYATESDLKLLDEYISGLENLDAERFQYRSIRFSNDTIYKKVDLANLITANFAPLGGYCYPGAASNQLVLGAPTHLLDRMERYVETLCEDTDEPVTKSYPLKQLTVATVLPILEYICPNSTVIPDHASNSVTVFGTESQHKRVAEFLQEMDVPRTGDMELVTEYHSGLGFPQGSFYYVYGTILQQFPYPEAAVIPQPETLDYIVTATCDVQEKIEALLESVRTNLEGKRARLEIYMLKNISMNRVLPLLQYTVPEAESIMPGKTSNELMVFAPEAVQNQIREILAKAEAVSEEDSNLIAKIYQVKDFHVDTALAIVTREFPMIMRMPLSVDKFMVWGTSLEHERIQKLIAEFQEVCPETVLRKYPLVHVTYPEIISYLLEAYYGQAIFSMTGNGELLADASEADQERIKETLRKLDVPISDKMRPVPIAYDISDIPIASHATIISNIMSIVPEATYLPSVSPGYFVLRAKPEDQKKIAEYIQEVLKEQPWLKLHMERYDLKNILFSQIYPMLAALAPNAQCTQGTRPNQLVVLAKATDQERIAEIINKLNEPGSGDRIPVVYRLKRARIYSVYGALAELYPTVGFVPDYAAKTLYVLATQSEQNDIGKLIGELDREDQEYQGFIKVHNLGNVYFGSITPVIRELYDDDPNFRMVVNSAHQSLIVYGTQEQQKCIEELIQSVKQGGLADRNMTIKAYTTRDYLSYYTLQRMFEEYDRVVPMYRDFSTGKLLVFGTPEEHKIVEDTLEILAPEKTDIAIFDLVYVDPQAAQQVLSMMESDGSYIDIQFDDMANQLYIRATPEKIEEIRQILIKMGEKGLENYKSLTSTLPGKTAGGTASGAGTFQVEDNGTFRTIRMDEDVKEVLEKVRKNWNRVNSLQVIPSGEGLIQTRENLSGSRENDVPLESTPGDLTPVPDPIAPVTSIPDEEEETEPDTVPLNPTPAVSVPQTPVSAVPVTPTKTDPVPEQAKPAPADSESTTPANPEKTGKTPGTTSVSSAMKTGKRNKASFRMFSSLTFSALMTGTLVADTR
ncbi:MAG: hypothetical protein IKW74_07280, partial [Thermoguttaceae bacterium]|nr:hypothetical protein [Thermoguttaceae bacterium]